MEGVEHVHLPSDTALDYRDALATLLPQYSDDCTAGEVADVLTEIDGYQNYSHDSEATHEIGLYGEVAAAKWYGVEVDDEIVRNGDGGYDIVVNRCNVDVKTVSDYGYETGREPLLKIHPKNWYEAKGTVDVYVLAELIDERHVRLIGRLSAHDVEDLDYREAGESFEDEFGNPVCLPSANYVAHTTDLIPLFID